MPQLLHLLHRVLLSLCPSSVSCVCWLFLSVGGVYFYVLGHSLTGNHPCVVTSSYSYGPLSSLHRKTNLPKDWSVLVLDCARRELRSPSQAQLAGSAAELCPCSHFPFLFSPIAVLGHLMLVPFRSHCFTEPMWWNPALSFCLTEPSSFSWLSRARGTLLFPLSVSSLSRSCGFHMVFMLLTFKPILVVEASRVSSA